MDAQRHWENIYGKNAAEAVSWYCPHLETSLELIERAAPEHSASIIDIGGGESTLVDDLLARGYQNISVLDISETAVDANKKRLGPASEQINWLVADITKVTLDACAYDVWHDGAVFHFLTSSEERVAYVRQVANAVKPGGHVTVSLKGLRRAAVWTWFAMTRSPCTASLECISACWGTPKNCIAHRSIQSNSFFIVSAG